MTRSDLNHSEEQDTRNPSPADPSYRDSAIAAENSGVSVEPDDPATNAGGYTEDPPGETDRG